MLKLCICFQWNRSSHTFLHNFKSLNPRPPRCAVHLGCLWSNKRTALSCRFHFSTLDQIASTIPQTPLDGGHPGVVCANLGHGNLVWKVVPRRKYVAEQGEEQNIFRSPFINWWLEVFTISISASCISFRALGFRGAWHSNVEREVQKRKMEKARRNSGEISCRKKWKCCLLFSFRVLVLPRAIPQFSRSAIPRFRQPSWIYRLRPILGVRRSGLNSFSVLRGCSSRWYDLGTTASP